MFTNSFSAVTQSTVANYTGRAESFRQWAFSTEAAAASGARNVFLEQLQRTFPRQEKLRILDAGCGPGRDLLAFCALGHVAEGLEPCKELAVDAQRASRAVVHCIDFQGAGKAALGPFHGIFCLASLFHVPRRELREVLQVLLGMLVEGGVILTTLPAGVDEDGPGGDGRWRNCMPKEKHIEALREVGLVVLTATENLKIYNGRWSMIISQRPSGGVAGLPLNASPPCQTLHRLSRIF